MRRLLSVWGLATALPMAGCFGDLVPEVGPTARARCVAEDSDPERDVHFTEDILDGIIRRPRGTGVGCGCHNPTDPTPIGIEIGGLNLTTYETLRQGGVNTGSSIVVPGDPCASLLVLKVGDAPPVGARMPFDGPPFLSEDDVRTIQDWIVEGARED